MKLKYEFCINQMGDEFVAVPLGNSVVDFNGILKLNEVAAFIVEQLNSDIEYDALVETVAKRFSSEIQEAKDNVDYIVSGLKDANLLAE